MSGTGPHAPVVWRRLLEWAARRLETPELTDDVAAIFREVFKRDGQRAARAWYRRQTLAALRHVPSVPMASWLDVKLAFRMLAKQPGLTVVAVFALALGIPAGLLPLHVVDSLTAPLPVPEGEEIVVVRNYDRSASAPVERPLHDYAQWRELSSFEDLGLWRSDLYGVGSNDGRAAPVRGARVTASVFSLLRVPPLLGRPLLESDEMVGATDVVVIGYDLWQSRLGGDPAVIGSTVRIAGVPHVIVGVMPEGFLFPVRDHLWLPFRSETHAYAPGEGPAASIVGRLADGASIEDARAEVEMLGRRMAERFPDTHAELQPQVLPYAHALTDMDGPDARSAILLTQSLALILLVLACGNVGILTLARVASRTGEIALRTALGAGRARILSQLFIESLVLALVAAGVGLVLLQAAATGPDFLVAELPFWMDFEVSPRTAVLAISLAVASAVIAGVVPAFKATGMRVQSLVRRSTGSDSGIRFGMGYSALIVAEVAATAWLLAVGSSLVPLAISKRGSSGIPGEQYLFAAIRFPGVDRTVGSADRAGGGDVEARLAIMHREVARRLSVEPAAGQVAIASALPGMSHVKAYVQVEGMPRGPDAPAPGHPVNVARVDIDYFDALDRPIVSGRAFGSGDLGEDRSAVIVNTSFVDRVLGGRNPLGRRLRYWAPGQEPGPWSYEIVGVVPSLGMNVLNPEADQGIYHAVAPGELHPVSFAVRVGADPERFTPRLRSIVADIDAAALVQDPMPLDDVPNSDHRLIVLWTGVVLVLGGIAVVLSAACLSALMSFTVARRTRECGIRTALGARPAGIVAAIARRAFVQLAAGVLIGAALSSAMLWAFDDNVVNRGVIRTSNWPLTVVVVSLSVVLVGLFACVKPALRALRIRPMEALKG